jgi:hypothetical protein
LILKRAAGFGGPFLVPANRFIPSLECLSVTTRFVVRPDEDKLMGKNQAITSANSGSRSKVAGNSVSGVLAGKDSSSRSKGARREILFPTEPTSIPHEKIDRAIDLVMSRKK